MSEDEKAYNTVWFIFGLVVLVFGGLSIYRYLFPKKESQRNKDLNAEIKELKSVNFDLKNRLIEKDVLLKAYKSKLDELEKQ